MAPQPLRQVNLVVRPPEAGMLTIRRPSEKAVAAFIAGQRLVPLSYVTEGMTRGPAPAGFNEDRLRRRVGAGPDDFDRACDAIRRWVAHQQGWVWAVPRDVPPSPGGLVAIVAHVGPCWWGNACRVVYTVDEAGPPRRFGFAYGTLAGHAEQGEARFTVEYDPSGVWYEVLTHSRPRHWLARLGYPVSRWYQRRFARGAAATLEHAVGALNFGLAEPGAAPDPAAHGGVASS
jgi:uncharacterized protein (UPF0548 family)